MGSKPPRSDALAAWIAAQRWFGGKRHRIVEVAVTDSIELGGATLHVVRVGLDNGDVQRYAVPLLPGAAPVDALADAGFIRGLVGLVREGGCATGRVARVTGHRASAFPDGLGADPSVRRIGGEQSNTSVVIGDAIILKHFRRLTAGVNPELEITRFLTDTARFPHTSALAGWLEYEETSGETATLAVAQTLVQDARDGWEWLLGALGDERRRGLTVPAVRRLGDTTAGMHQALAAAPESLPALAQEPITGADVAAWTAAITKQLADARAAAPDGAAVPTLAPAQLETALAALLGRARCRHHGDFHFGQTLYREATGAWTIIDFEGEPMRPLHERRAKHSPLRDVAGLLRSIAYAAETTRAAGAAAWTETWEREARAAFLEGYLAAAGRASFLAHDVASTLRVVAAFEVEKAAYEVVYEANNRPDWVAIPLRGLARAATELASVR
jgi:trehalose synthase-fused probable maltokinase